MLDLAGNLWPKKAVRKASEHDPMMNRFEGPGAKEARIRYLDGDFQVTSPGSFVRCAVTGEQIPLDELALLERRAAGALSQRRPSR